VVFEMLSLAEQLLPVATLVRKISLWPYAVLCANPSAYTALAACALNLISIHLHKWVLDHFLLSHETILFRLLFDYSCEPLSCGHHISSTTVGSGPEWFFYFLSCRFHFSLSVVPFLFPLCYIRDLYLPLGLPSRWGTSTGTLATGYESPSGTTCGTGWSAMVTAVAQ